MFPYNEELGEKGEITESAPALTILDSELATSVLATILRVGFSSSQFINFSITNSGHGYHGHIDGASSSEKFSRML